jgi:hypothetical protein
LPGAQIDQALLRQRLSSCKAFRRRLDGFDDGLPLLLAADKVGREFEEAGYVV